MRVIFSLFLLSVAFSQTTSPPPLVNVGGYWDSVILGWSGLMPIAASIVLYAWYVYSHDGVFSVLSWFITLSSIPLYALQAYINDLEFDPFYAVVTKWAFPNLECVVMGSLVVFVVFFRYWYNVRISWLQCAILALLVAFPPIVHVWRANMAWWKAVVSFLIGVGMAVPFCPILWINQMGFAYLFNLHGSYSWYNESILLRDEESRLTYRRLRKWRDGEEQRLKSATYSWASFSMLAPK